MLVRNCEWDIFHAGHAMVRERNVRSMAVLSTLFSLTTLKFCTVRASFSIFRFSIRQLSAQFGLAETVQAQQLESRNLSIKIDLFHNCLRLTTWLH